jgi:hypothetical protein
MDNEKGILKTLLASLEFQLALHNRLLEVEIHHKVLAEHVRDEFPSEMWAHCDERYKDLLNQAKSDTSLVPYGIREAVAEIPHLLTKKN